MLHAKSQDILFEPQFNKDIYICFYIYLSPYIYIQIYLPHILGFDISLDCLIDIFSM